MNKSALKTLRRAVPEPSLSPEVERPRDRPGRARNSCVRLILQHVLPGPPDSLASADWIEKRPPRVWGLIFNAARAAGRLGFQPYLTGSKITE